MPCVYKFLSTPHQSHNEKVLLFTEPPSPTPKFRKRCGSFQKQSEGAATHTESYWYTIKRVNRVTFENSILSVLRNLCTNKRMVTYSPTSRISDHLYLRRRRNSNPGYWKETSPCSGKCLSVDHDEATMLILILKIK